MSTAQPLEVIVRKFAFWKLEFDMVISWIYATQVVDLSAIS